MSNYLAQGLNQGFDAGQRAYENKKKRKQDEELEAARRQLELDKQAKDSTDRKALQDAELTFRGSLSADERLSRAVEADKDREFRGGEGEKDRGFRKGERVDSQGFQSSQSELDRAARVLSQDKDLAARKDAQDVELPLKGADLGLRARHQQWLESPANPYNDIRDAQAEKLRAMAADYGGVPPPNLGKAPVPGAPQTAPAGGRITTQEPPADAIQMLRSNPTLAGAFDAKYGAGAAQKYLQQARK